VESLVEAVHVSQGCIPGCLVDADMGKLKSQEDIDGFSHSFSDGSELVIGNICRGTEPTATNCKDIWFVGIFRQVVIIDATGWNKGDIGCLVWSVKGFASAHTTVHIGREELDGLDAIG
jgi:hypothetical protein